MFCLPNNKILTMLSSLSVSPIYKNMYPFFIANNLIPQNQSGFKEGDSCINQLLSMTHDIYHSYHEDTCAILDISKAFDKMWHICP